MINGTNYQLLPSVYACVRKLAPSYGLKNLGNGLPTGHLADEVAEESKC